MVGNGDGGIKFESINELVWEKELEEVLQVGAQVWQQQQFLQLQMNYKFWFPFHHTSSTWAFFNYLATFVDFYDLNLCDASCAFYSTRRGWREKQKQKHSWLERFFSSILMCQVITKHKKNDSYMITNVQQLFF